MTSQDRDGCSEDVTYFGACPECGRTDGYCNAGDGHWFFCRLHRHKWNAGENLFSSGREESHVQQREAFAEVQQFHTVEPIYPDKPRALKDPAFDAFMRKALE
jgi:hypothetical protein